MKLSRCGALLLFLLCASSTQADDLPWHLGGGLAWTSDYVLRGVSQSDNRPVLQGNVHIEPWPQWTLGAWASTVRFIPQQPSTELDVFISKHWSLKPNLSLQVAWTHYSYIDDPRRYSYSYNELNAALNWRDTWLFGASWSPDTALAAPYGVNDHQQTATLEATYHYVLPYRFELRLGAGYYALLEQHEGSYGFGNAGISRALGPLRAELSWFWTANANRRVYTPGPAGGPWTFTLMWDF